MKSKLFLPQDSIVDSYNVKLNSGETIPYWAFVAVPIEGESGTNKALTPPVDSGIIVDLLTGSITTEIPVLSKGDSSSGENFSQTYDFSGFSSKVKYDDLKQTFNAIYETASTDNVVVAGDPGYFTSIGSEGSIRPSEPTPIETSTEFKLSDFLVNDYKTQSLPSNRRTEILSNLSWLATNVVALVNKPNPSITEFRSRELYGYNDRTLDFNISSGFVEKINSAPFKEFYDGKGVELEFNAPAQLVYQKAIDIVLKIDFDQICLEYYPNGSSRISIIAQRGSNARKILTKFDGVVTSYNRLMNCSRVSDIVTLEVSASHDDYANPGDSYTNTIDMVKNNPDLFGGVVAANELLKKLGIDPLSGVTSELGKLAETVRSVLKCPDKVKTDANLFPTSSHSALRTLSDKSQMDSSSTQDNLAFNIRANNPLGVKVVKGVTDLKTRFGFLGEANGIAVYRDHVGGAAAGLNYINSKFNGSTVANATRGMFGDALKKEITSLTDFTSDLTALSGVKLFSDVSKHLFGAADPTGVLQECAAVDSSNIESSISYAAAMSKTLSNHTTSPLTYEEWTSAWHISKNTANGHITKTTTGVNLPAQEKTTTQDTGVQTSSQGSTDASLAEKDRSAGEKWNPVTNFDHYSQNRWDQWMSSNLISYSKKSSSTDTTSIAKIPTEAKMKQDSKHPSHYTSLE